jgi:hypothetical protein
MVNTNETDPNVILLELAEDKLQKEIVSLIIQRKDNTKILEELIEFLSKSK